MKSRVVILRVHGWNKSIHFNGTRVLVVGHRRGRPCAAYAINCALIRSRRSINRDPSKLLFQLTAAFYVAFVDNQSLVYLCTFSLRPSQRNVFACWRAHRYGRLCSSSVFGRVHLRCMFRLLAPQTGNVPMYVEIPDGPIVYDAARAHLVIICSLIFISRK